MGQLQRATRGNCTVTHGLMTTMGSLWMLSIVLAPISVLLRPLLLLIARSGLFLTFPNSFPSILTNPTKTFFSGVADLPSLRDPVKACSRNGCSDVHCTSHLVWRYRNGSELWSSGRYAGVCCQTVLCVGISIQIPLCLSEKVVDECEIPRESVWMGT